MKTVAFLVVDSPKVFQFLGHQPLMFWILEKLLEVRGLDRIVCAVKHDLFAQAKSALGKYEGVECVAMPKELKAGNGYNAWCNTQTTAYDVAMRFKPTVPFLPASKIEKCLNLVTKNKATRVTPARRLNKVCEEPMDLTVCHNRKPAHGQVTVPVSLIESLDADDPDEYVLISAMVESGKM